MTVLGRCLVFQSVLLTQTCTYNSNNIITLQNIDITDFPSIFFFQKNITTPPPPPTRLRPRNKHPKTYYNNNKRSHNTSESFDMSLKLSKLHIKMAKVTIK